MKKNAGFGLVGIVLVVVLVLLLGIVAWRIYDASKPKQSDKPSTQTSSNLSSSTTPSTNTATYLDIKELGIKFKLTDDIKDAVYYYDASNTSAAPVARVSTQSLVDKSGGTCNPKTSAAFGSIRKMQSLTQADGTTLSVNNTSVFQLGNDYIVYSTPNQPCSTDKTVSDVETTQLQFFKQALQTVQLDH
jgi:hypothetical protein